MEWWNGFFSHSFCLLVCVLTVSTGKSRNEETRNETKRHFKVERSWRSCACAPSLMVLPDRKGSEYPLSLIRAVD